MPARWGPPVVAAAVLALIAIITLVVSPTGRATDDAAAAVVPFVDDPFTPEPMYRIVPPAPADLPDCRLQDFELISAERRPPIGSFAWETGAGIAIEARNGGAECALGGGPLITLSSPSGAGEPMTADLPHPSQTDLPARWAVPEGGRVLTSVGLAGEPCTRFPDATWQLTVGDRSPQQLTTSIPAPGCTQPDSGGDIVRSGAWDLYEPPDDPVQPLPIDDLLVTIAAAQTVKFGEPVEYTVILSNPTDQPISLIPCPTYNQIIGEGAFATDYYGTLNCAQAPGSIAPSDQVRFAMSIAIPPELSGVGRSSKLSWTLYPADRPGASLEDPIRVVS